jgi:hypothetical protein
MKPARDSSSVWLKLIHYPNRARTWTVPRFAMFAVAVALVCELNAVVKGDSVAVSALALAASFVALVLLIACDALGYFR